MANLTRLIIIFAYTSTLLVFNVYGFGSEISNNTTHPLPWCYTDASCGESTWPKECKESKHQISPIDLTQFNLTHNRIAYLERDSYVFNKFDLEYKGYIIQIIPEKASKRKLLSQPEEYLFHSFHLHWGSQHDVGSEHTIDGKSYPIELHLVFYNSRYANLTAAVDDNKRNPISIAVLGVFLEIEPYEGVPATTKFLDSVIKALDTKNGSDLRLNEIFYADKVYKYVGGSTSPPCEVTCQWFIIRKPVLVPLVHVLAIQQAGENNELLKGNNFRSLKSRNKDMKLLLGNIHFHPVPVTTTTTTKKTLF